MPLLVLALCFGYLPTSIHGTELESDFLHVQSLLKKYCFECHSEDTTEAEIDLSEFSTLGDARKQLKVWIKIQHMLESRQMPPKDSVQPTDSARLQLHNWVQAFLTQEAKASAGDPGPVVLRRLSNDEFNYTIRDLTGIDSLNPTNEFPIDGAAGEGFTNTGNALVMSPSLVQKYLDAAKQISKHTVLLPDGIRFSRHTTRRDKTNELLAQIREFYGRFALTGDRQGQLPVEPYVTALVTERSALNNGQKSIHDVAVGSQLNGKYLAKLWRVLNSRESSDSFLLRHLRQRWMNSNADEIPTLIGEIQQWQKVLWKFNSIGHINRAGGPPSWQQAVLPLTSKQDFTISLPPVADGQDALVYLVASDLGDGSANDYVLWKSPKVVGGSQPQFFVRDAGGLQKQLGSIRRNLLKKTTSYLQAIAHQEKNSSTADLAKQHGLDETFLAIWLRYLDLETNGPVKVTGHFQKKILRSGNYDFVNGWGTHATPSVSANSSDQEVRIPGVARPRGVVVHPSPTRFAAVGWHSPMTGVVRIEGRIADAHPECGNGVEWFVQHRTSQKVENIWKGEIDIRGSAEMTAKTISVRKGELVSFLVGPRSNNHACDLTAIDFTISETDGAQRVWDLGQDVAGDILASNPHTDSYRNLGVWHFYQGKMKDVHKSSSTGERFPPGSLLAAWRDESDFKKRDELAKQIQDLALGNSSVQKDSPNGLLYAYLQRFPIPFDHPATKDNIHPDSRFGKHPLGHTVDATDLAVQAPAVVELRIPAELAAGRQFRVSAQLDSQHGQEGSVQVQVLTGKPDRMKLSPGIPIVVTENSVRSRQIASELNAFRDLFPIALCYERIVPIDEVVTLTLYYREDDFLKRLMLDDSQINVLDRLWDELLYVGQEPLAYQVALEQIREFATQDRPDLVESWKPVVKPTELRAKKFREYLVETEPFHVQAILDFADRSWRRELKSEEIDNLRNFYHRLRESEISHDEAIRLLLTRVLTSPAFLYRLEATQVGPEPTPVSNIEIASRLSYFLWSSLPDQELRTAARNSQLVGGQQHDELLRQTRRMLKDSRTRRLAIQFACQWLHIRNFDQNEEKNEKLFPEFETLRTDIYQETVRFFEDMFRNDGSILDLLNADHTFLNESLAKHYGIEGVVGPTWKKVDGLRARGRGGILGMATILASQSGASRTSPILRGNWISETLLGEQLPKPPANVPQLPDEVPTGLTARQLIERHSSVEACAKCHARIDPYGFALEQFDAVGRIRPTAQNTTTTLLDGKTIEGLDGLRNYLVHDRQHDIVRQFCKKLLGYALGREVQLSDQMLLDEIQDKLARHDYRFRVAVEAMVTSAQFRKIRGRDFQDSGFDD